MIHRNENKLAAHLRIAGIFLIASLAGCAGRPQPPEADPPWAASQQKAASAPQAAAKPVPAPKPETPVVAAPPPAMPETPVAKPAASAPASTAPETPAEKPAAAARPETTAEKPAAPAVKAPAPKQPAAPAPKPSTLDLASLEKRLKDTPAIGVFTKLTLKNQVDDLVGQFRAHYQGKTKTTLAALRQPYDQLVLKVLALLQDGDPPLARAVAESREAIWGILSDPEKFKNL